MSDLEQIGTGQQNVPTIHRKYIKVLRPLQSVEHERAQASSMGSSQQASQARQSRQASTCLHQFPRHPSLEKSKETRNKKSPGAGRCTRIRKGPSILNCEGINEIPHSRRGREGGCGGALPYWIPRPPNLGNTSESSDIADLPSFQQIMQGDYSADRLVSQPISQLAGCRSIPAWSQGMCTQHS